MEEFVIERRTVKDQMTDRLSDMKVDEQFTVELSDRGKWATHISNHIHPVVDRRYSVITDREVCPVGKAIVKRTK